MRRNLFLLTILLACAAIAGNQTITTNRDFSGDGYAITPGGYDGEYLAGTLRLYTDSYVSFQREEELGRDFGSWTADSITFGYYTMNSWGAPETMIAWPGGSESGSFGELAAGSFLGFTISNGETTIYSGFHTPGIQGDNYGYATDAYVRDGMLYIGFLVNGYSGSTPEAIYYSVNLGVPSTPNGQPLPGVLASLALAGGIFAIRRKRLLRNH